MKNTRVILDFTYNHGNNIVGLFDVLTSFPFITSETKRDY